MERQFSRAQVEEILRRVAERSAAGDEPALSGRELAEVAQQAGFDPQTVSEVIAELEGHQSEARAVERWLSRRRRRLTNHALSWLVISIGLLALNLLIGGALWFQFPMVSWAIVLALHAVFALRAAAPERLEKIRLAQRKRDHAQRKREEKQRAQQRRTRDGSEVVRAFETAVEDGVSALLTAASRSLSRALAQSQPPQRVETDFSRFVAERERRGRGEATTVSQERIAERFPDNHARPRVAEPADDDSALDDEQSAPARRMRR